MAYPYRLCLLFGLVLSLALLDHFVVAQIAQIAKDCKEWKTKFGVQWLSPKSSDCRKPGGSDTIDCCQLYLRMNGALRFFVTSPPDGLGCGIREGEALFFAKLYFTKCASFAATIQPPCPRCGNSGILATPTASVQPSPTPAGFIDVVPRASPVPTASQPAGSTPTAGATTGSVTKTPTASRASTTPPGTDTGSGKTPTPASGGNRAANANSPNSATRSICFHGSGVAQLRDGRSIRLDALSVGDEVLVGGGGFSTVFLFTHKSAELAQFVKMTTVHGLSLSVTPGHLVHTREGLVRAGDIRVGDFLLDQHKSPQAVATVSEFTSKGIYNPHTMHGDIVVNGLTVSTYTTHVPVRAAHPLLSIFRSLWRATGWYTDILNCGTPSFASVQGSSCV